MCLVDVLLSDRLTGFFALVVPSLVTVSCSSWLLRLGTPGVRMMSCGGDGLSVMVCWSVLTLAAKALVGPGLLSVGVGVSLAVVVLVGVLAPL